GRKLLCGLALHRLRSQSEPRDRRGVPHRRSVPAILLKAAHGARVSCTALSSDPREGADRALCSVRSGGSTPPLLVPLYLPELELHPPDGPRESTCGPNST